MANRIQFNLEASKFSGKTRLLIKRETNVLEKDKTQL